jgi:hypothetical protein
MSSERTVPESAKLTRAQHVMLIAAVVLCRVFALRSCPIYDDAFITFRYARNLAEGLGLVYNPGAEWEPVLGTTTPLYALLLAGVAKLGLDLTVASIALNMLFDAITAWLVPRLFGFRRIPSTFALLLLAALPQIVRISVGGMESPLFALCGIGAAVALSSARPVVAGVLAASACLVRPEGVLLAGILFVARMRSPRELVRYAVPVIAIGIAAVVALTLMYGSPIPQSVLAKSTMHGSDVLAETLGRWKTILTQSFAPSWALVLFLPLVVYGAGMSLARPGALRIFSLWSLGITASYLLARPHTWGWYYYVPLVAWTLWFGLGAERACAWIAPRVSEPQRRFAGKRGPELVAACAIAGAAIVCWSWPTPVNVKVYAPMQAWAAAASAARPGARIQASDIGAIGWAWKGTLLDSEGLVWPDALRYQQPNAIIEEFRPEYVLLVAERPRVKHFRDRPELYAQYEPIARFSAKGLTKLEPALDEVAMEWTQDYIVYKRRDL